MPLETSITVRGGAKGGRVFEAPMRTGWRALRRQFGERPACVVRVAEQWAIELGDIVWDSGDLPILDATVDWSSDDRSGLRHM